MQIVRAWVVALVVGCAGIGWAEEASSDEALVQAQKDIDEAKVLDKAGKYGAAVTLSERALAVREKALGPQHLQVAEALDLLGNLLRRRTEFKRAEPLLERALQIREAALGKDDPDVARSLTSLAALYAGQGTYGRAEPLFQRALQIREATLGPNHPDVAQSLNDLGTVYSEQGAYGRAEPLLQRALQIRETTLGKDHPDVVRSLLSLARLYLFQGGHERAEAAYQRALRIQEAAQGEEHPTVASILYGLAAVYLTQAAYGRAEPILLRALRIQEKALGKDHPDLSYSLNNLASVYTQQGAYERAEPLYLRALKIRESALGKAHPDVISVLNNLALMYKAQGAYGRAEVTYLRALQVGETTLGKEHPSVSDTLNNLASVYYLRGAYGRAEQNYLRALRIRESALGKAHPDVASSFANLANLYRDQGDHVRAEPLYINALRIKEAALGEKHPDIAIPLNSLANLYTLQGDYARAEPLYQRALALSESALGKSHYSVGLPLANLANIYLVQGSYARAEALQIRALETLEATLGKNHPSIAKSLNSLGLVYRSQGDLEHAKRLHLRALQITETALGKSHPDIVEAIVDLALLALARNQLSEATPLFERVSVLTEERLRREALDFSESRLSRFINVLGRSDNLLYNLLHEHPDDRAARRLALTAALLRKARSADDLAATSRAINLSLGPSDREVFERLRNLRTQLAALSLSGPGKLTPAVYQAQLKELETRGDALEGELAQRSSVLRVQRQLPGPGDIIPRVTAALPSDGALIELVAFPASPLVPPPNTPTSKVSSTPVYFALVLLPSGDIGVADLGPAAPIDNAVVRLRQALAGRDAIYLPAAQELYRLVFAPIAPLLGAQRHIFVAPDGQLGLLPWAALHDGARDLMDAFQLTYLVSGKDLLPRAAEIPPSRSVVVFADPDFTAPTPVDASRRNDAPAPLVPSPPERSFAVDDFFARRDSNLWGRSWPPLPGARQEATLIRILWPEAQLFVGPTATKQALLQTATPGILHIATHGFFLDDVETLSSTRGIAVTGELSGTGPGRTPSDPLLRSGLVLAGAHPPATATGKDVPPRLEESIVTALELAGMNLWGTELVVLSACDTGQGDAKNGQGVYGLRRAFAIAGAETLVTSLWKVDDTPTRELMETYYRGLQNGQGRAAAMQAAMREVRAHRPHPYNWAPFIVLGNGAPLRGVPPVHP